MTDQGSYEQMLAEEAELWGNESERVAQQIPPDWRYHRKLRHNVIMHGANIEGLLDAVQPGMKVLELGCASGWLTLAMAQRGAEATGMDLSEKSLKVARDYYESIKAGVKGSVTYQPVDMNTLDLPADTYDIIAAKAVLHHLMNLEHVMQVMHRALKPGGLLWVEDTDGEEARSTVLGAGALCFVLPTETSYADKIRALFKFGLKAPSRVKASIEAEGLSPFEGAGREGDWVDLIHHYFTVEKRVDAPAITGYVAAQLKAPEWVAIPFLKILYRLDRAMVRLGLLHNTGLCLHARKA